MMNDFVQGILLVCAVVYTVAFVVYLFHQISVAAELTNNSGRMDAMLDVMRDEALKEHEQGETLEFPPEDVCRWQFDKAGYCTTSCNADTDDPEKGSFCEFCGKPMEVVKDE